MAIITRWRMPPDSSCGNCFSRLSASEMRTAFSASMARWRASAGDRLVWASMDSMSWRPIDSTGFSEVIGSWKIMAMRLPRMRRICRSLSRARSVSPRRMAPADMRAAGCGRSCMIASDVIDLPEPDSPAMQSVSPRESRSERPDTTSRSPSSPRTLTDRPAMSSTGPVAASEAVRFLPASWLIQTRSAGSRTRPPSSACRRSR